MNPFVLGLLAGVGILAAGLAGIGLTGSKRVPGYVSAFCLVAALICSAALTRTYPHKLTHRQVLQRYEQEARLMQRYTRPVRGWLYLVSDTGDLCGVYAIKGKSMLRSTEGGGNSFRLFARRVGGDRSVSIAGRCAAGLIGAELPGGTSLRSIPAPSTYADASQGQVIAGTPVLNVILTLDRADHYVLWSGPYLVSSHRLSERMWR